jgi:hypothetical protein
VTYDVSIAVSHFWAALASSPDPALPSDVVRGEIAVAGGGPWSTMACFLAGCLWPRERVEPEYVQ